MSAPFFPDLFLCINFFSYFIFHISGVSLFLFLLSHLSLPLRDFLPRGSGIVTRRPLILQLVNNIAGEYACPVLTHPDFLSSLLCPWPLSQSLELCTLYAGHLLNSIFFFSLFILFMPSVSTHVLYIPLCPSV